MQTADQFTEPLTHHGEGPFWDAPNNRLLCMDVLAGAVVAVDDAGDHRRYLVPSKAATMIRRRARGGFVVATEHELMTADEELTAFETLAILTDDPSVRTNDGGCDPLGAFVIGTMAYDEKPDGGAVYRVAPGSSITTTLVAPVSISNGVQWSADGRRVYYIDSPTRRVDVFDSTMQTGAWSDRRTHISFEATDGFPDGMAIDEEDGIWIAMWGGGAVHHYDKSGRLVEKIAVPEVTQASSCAFGGRDRTTLYITTSRAGLDDTAEPKAGSVFVYETAVRGAAVTEFAG